MSIPEACIEAVRVVLGYSPEDRASRVILALAESLPDSVVTKALEAATFSSIHNLPIQQQRRWMRAAIIDALKDIVGETP